MTDEEKQRKIAEENRKLTDIQKQVNEYAGECPDFAKEWIKKRLESYAIKHDYNLPPANDIGNTMDWLHSLQAEDPKLAGKIDRISWEAGQGHQEKWHDKLAKKAEKLSKFEGNPDDVTPIINYEGGFKWVKLNSDEAKDFEGDAMGNCVGQGNYDDQTIFSLRDKDNFPHITVEYDEGTKTIKQMKCKGNSEVADAYMPVVEDLINGLKPKKIRDISDYAISKDGKYYLGVESINQATENGSKFDKDKINTLNDYAISTDGSLYVGNDKINQATENGSKFDKDKINIRNDYAFSTDGSLYIGNDKINQATENGSKFDKNNINIFDKYNINIHTRRYALSKDGSLYVGNDKINQAYDNGVKFEKINPNMINTNSKMSYALSTDGTLYLGEDAIKNIPEDVILKEVDIRNSNITEWNHKVEGFFYASNSSLTNIGPNAEFGGNIWIKDCRKLTEFNNKVEGHFNAKGSGLTTIGPDAEFGGSVDVKDCYYLHEWNHKVPDYFNASDSGLTKIGQNAEFGGSVYIKNCRNLTEFNHKVPNGFDASYSSLEKIGPNAEFGDFVVIDCTPLSEEIGMHLIETPEEKQAFADAIKSMDSKQEPEQAPEPEEEEHSMSM